MIFVTAVKMAASGSRHEHITDVQWRNSADDTTGYSSLLQVVQFIEAGNAVQVEGPPTVNVGVNKTTADQKYIQTYADRTWTNNLLSLPRYS